MNRKKRVKKDLVNLGSDLNKPKYAKKVEQNTQVHRQRRKIKEQIARFETELKTAKGGKRGKIQKILESLRKAEEINKTAFFKK